MPDPETLLLPLFHDLRRQGFPLGVGEYLQAVETVAAAGPHDVDLVWWLCRLLWAKSAEDQQVFDVVFRRHAEVRLDIPPPVVTPPVPSAPEMSALPDQAPPTEWVEEQPPTPAEPPDAVTGGGIVSGNVSLAGWAGMPGRHHPSGLPARFQFTPRLPMAQRDMSGIWRHLRRLQRAGSVEDLDVDGTIDQISRSGVFLGPVLQPRRRNQVRLVLLVDRDEAMSAFAPVVEATIQSILRGGLLGQTATYYFHGYPVPEGVLYERASLQRARPVDEVLAERAGDSSVLFISDAGAARGRYESARVEGTNRFLKMLRGYIYRYAWLNPVPEHRWAATTAEAVSRKAPMFPMSRDGLIDTVNILRGHPFPPGVG